MDRCDKCRQMVHRRPASFRHMQYRHSSDSNDSEVAPMIIALIGAALSSNPELNLLVIIPISHEQLHEVQSCVFNILVVRSIESSYQI